MTAPRNDLNADVERRLTASFHDRAATIVTAPRYTVPDRGPQPAYHRHVVRYRLISAALAATIAAVWIAIGVEHHDTSRTALGPQQCVRVAPNDFAAVLNANRIPGVTGTVVSGASDGTLLIAGPGNRSLDLVDPDGRVTRIWTASGDEVATIDPQAALNDYAAVFAVSTQYSNPASIEVYRRDENRLETLATTTPGAPLLAVAPITMDGTGYWVTSTAAGTEEINYFELEDQTSTPDSVGTIPARGVTQLLAVGGTLFWVQNATQLEFYPKELIPTSVGADSRSGSNYTSDRTTVAWLTNSGDHYTYWTWTPGDPNPVRKPLTWKENGAGLLGPYLTAASNAILDTTAGATVVLPTTTRLIGVYGSEAVLSTTQDTGAIAISRIALDDLAVARC